MPLRLPLRAVVFTLASLSFACLLGQFFGLWSMHLFGCWVLPPATVLLAFIAWRARGKGGGYRAARTPGSCKARWAACSRRSPYDLYRLPFVLGGAPLFKVFPRFGQLLLGASEPVWLVQMLGWSYHFSNGAALGIMFLSLAVTANRRVLFWGAVAWALFVEAMLLLTPYASFFGLPSMPASSSLPPQLTSSLASSSERGARRDSGGKRSPRREASADPDCTIVPNPYVLAAEPRDT
jgi:hypothetical protein